jgi:hypothetical protein
MLERVEGLGAVVDEELVVDVILLRIGVIVGEGTASERLGELEDEVAFVGKDKMRVDVGVESETARTSGR